MKRIYSLLFLLSIAFSSNAQSGWCGTEERLQDSPEMIEALQKELNDPTKSRARKSNHKIIIPTVVHVIHYNGLGNISKNQILDGIRIVNEDFNKLNADTSTIRSIFQSLSVSSDVEFRLAKKDPNGNCTEGITRTNSYMSLGPSNRNLPKSLIQWDPLRYMNVWVVFAFEQTTLLGFAQFPSNTNPNLSTYGIMVRADEWGNIELAAGSGGRTVTHEFGHCLDLLHPFQGACGSLCQGTGDFVCDVPPQINDLGNSCSPSFNTCSNDALGGNSLNPNPFTTNVPDMVENFMGYGTGCAVLYTPGQKLRIDRAFAAYNQFSTLIDTANQTFTGTKDGYVSPACLPIAEILDFDKFTCAGGSIQFSESSYGGPITTYNWSFPGGTPSTSSLAQPTITYNTPGHYDVILRVSNTAGTDSVVLSNYVHVEGAQATYSGFNYTEGFENATSYANDWVIVSPSGAPTFDRANFVGKTGTSSLWLNNLNNVFVGGIDRAISPSIKMSDVLSPSISIDVAYRRRTTSSNDRLIFKASLDCGNTWLTILSTTPAFFAYDNSTQTTNFFPTQGSQWKNVTIPAQFIPANIRSANRVKFMLEVEHGDGNNFYFDDFKILGQPVGIEANKVKPSVELSIYPNPAKDQINLTYSPLNEVQQANIYLTNVVGEKVLEVYQGSMNKQEYKFFIDSSNLPKGIYFLSIDGSDRRISRKVVIH